MIKRNSRCLLRLLIVAALLGAGLAVILLIGRIAAPLPLPNPNGYEDLIKAGQAVAGNIDDATSLDHEGLRALVATNAEALRLLRVGLARRCAVPTDAQVANFGVVMSDLGAIKSLAKVLIAEGRLAEMDNRLSDAARSYIDSIRLGNQMSRGGLMINRLVGVACQGMGTIPLAKLLLKLTCKQIRPVVAELERIDDGTVSWREVMRNENRFVRAQTANPFVWLSGLWQGRRIRQGAREKHDLAAAHLRLLTAEVALRSYKCDQGSAPGNLAQLVPKYLRQLPTDPFSGKPLVYRPSGTNWVLYSLGPDRANDGGEPIGNTSEDNLFVFGGSQSSKSQNKGDLRYDSPW